MRYCKITELECLAYNENSPDMSATTVLFTLTLGPVSLSQGCAAEFCRG